MKVESKYNLGEHIWIVLEARGELSVYDDYITSVIIDKNGIMYETETDILTINEDSVIQYEDRNRLYETIKNMMKKIRQKEESEGEKEDELRL